METAHLLCDSDDFEGVILTLKKEGAELERELDEAKAEVAQLKEENYLVWQRFDKQMAAEAEVERLNNILENTRISRATIIEDRNLLDQELAASKAEVERLREDNQKLRARLNYVQGCDCDNYLHPYCNKLTK
jgi:monomeric isocitrate dehydrogenase